MLLPWPRWYTSCDGLICNAQATGRALEGLETKSQDLSDDELDAIFKKIDRDGNKTLDKAELGMALSQTGKLKSEVDKFLRQLGDDFKPLTSAEFKDVIRGKGELGKKFSGQLSTTLGDLSTETGLRKLFDEIDRDKGAHRVVPPPHS